MGGGGWGGGGRRSLLTAPRLLFDFAREPLHARAHARQSPEGHVCMSAGMRICAGMPICSGEHFPPRRSAPKRTASARASCSHWFCLAFVLATCLGPLPAGRPPRRLAGSMSSWAAHGKRHTASAKSVLALRMHGAHFACSRRRRGGWGSGGARRQHNDSSRQKPQAASHVEHHGHAVRCGWAENADVRM